jgi:5'(3')-deoxyribonucleotidase
MAPPTILIDMDETLCDLMTPWLSEINARYGTAVRREDVKTWDVFESIKDLLPRGVTLHEVLIPIQIPGTFVNLRPMPGSVKTVRQMLSLGWDVALVTALPGSVAQPGIVIGEKVRWVEENLPELSGNVVVTSAKHRVRGDVLIDDSPKFLSSFPGFKIVFDAPWNQGLAGMRRITSWDCAIEACELILGL